MSRCVRCLAETPPETFFANDYRCDVCAALGEEFPLASTPDAKERCGLCGVGDVADLVTHSGEKIRPDSIVIPVCSSCRKELSEEFRRTLVKTQNGLSNGTRDEDAGAVPEPNMAENIKKLDEHARSVTGIVDLPRAPAATVRHVPVDLGESPLFPGVTVGYDPAARNGDMTAYVAMFRCPQCGTNTVLDARLVSPEPDEGEGPR